jgi:acetyltransferase-like isoleucine patch superfamily enzyme
MCRSFMLAKCFPGRLMRSFQSFLLVRRYLFALSMLIISFIGYIPSHTIRNNLYKLLGLNLGKGSTIYSRAEIRSPHKIVIGMHTVIGNQAILDGRGGLEIGNNVNFSTGVWIWTVQHDKDDPYFGSLIKKVVIRDYAWISCRTTLLPGITIGEGAVVCAGAVVTKDVDPYSVVAGVPAKKIGDRKRNLKYKLSDEIVAFL